MPQTHLVFGELELAHYGSEAFITYMYQKWMARVQVRACNSNKNL